MVHYTLTIIVLEVVQYFGSFVSFLIIRRQSNKREERSTDRDKISGREFKYSRRRTEGYEETTEYPRRRS